MRILFTFVGGYGHFLPQTPVAHAAAKAGHTVAFACAPAMMEVVEKNGFETLRLGNGPAAAPERLPLQALDVAREEQVFREHFARRAARERVPLVTAVCEQWRPNVIVTDEADFGSMIAAEKLGLPHATVLVMAAGSFIRADLVTEVVNEVRQENGLTADKGLEMVFRHLALMPFPPSFREPAFPLPVTARAFRPQDQVEQPPLPDWWPGLPGGLNRQNWPLIYFTLGTVFNMESGDLFNRALAGLGQVQARVLVTVGRHIDPTEFGPQPPHIHIERFVPQESILPYCDLVISHAGSGSLSGAMAHGKPTVLIPMGADQMSNASRAVAVGLGPSLDPLTLTPASLVEAVTDGLQNPRYRQVAEQLRDEQAGLPGIDTAVTWLEALSGP